MAVDRPTVSERIYADGWYELTESGVSALKSGSTATAYASYSFYTNNSLYYPTAYKGIKFHFSSVSSSYAQNYKLVGQSEQKAKKGEQGYVAPGLLTKLLQKKASF